MDVVEVSPLYDGPGQITALHATRLILDTVGAGLPTTEWGATEKRA